MKRALTALEIIERFLDPLAKWQVRKPKDGGPIITIYPQKVAEEAINDLRQAVAKTEKQKPVAHVYRIEENGRPCVAWDNASEIKVGAKLYAAPPKRDLTCVCGAVWDGEQMVHAPPKQWVGLTEEEIQNLGYLSEKFDASNSEWFDRWGFSRAIEAKLREKNHG